MSQKKVILLTGINGYIASHIGLQLLQKGYIVRGTSRSTSAKQYLLDGAFHGYNQQYEHVVVPDMTAAGAFDEAVKGVYAIIHTASPVHFTGTTVEEYFEPAVGGVVSILDSTKHASQLQAFVLTSSVAAISDRWKNPPTHAYSEDDWNTSGEQVARETFSAPVAYGASKAIAERAMWDWRDKKSPSFAMSAIQPGVVMGPPITWPESPEKLNATLQPIWAIWSGGEISTQIGAGVYIDVRDVAAIHVWCAENPHKSGGQRYLASNGKAPPQAFADILRKHFPDRKMPTGNPGQGYIDGYWYPEEEPKFVAKKAYAAMGVERFTDIETTILDTVDAFEKQWPGLAAKTG